MLALVWNLSAALNGYMRFYMPTNRAVDWLRSPRGSRWAIPAAFTATLVYLFSMSVCATIVERTGPGYLNVLVLLFERAQVHRSRSSDALLRPEQDRGPSDPHRKFHGSPTSGGQDHLNCGPVRLGMPLRRVRRHRSPVARPDTRRANAHRASSRPGRTGRRAWRAARRSTSQQP